jgi:hypothetical protein
MSRMEGERMKMKEVEGGKKKEEEKERADFRQI